MRIYTKKGDNGITTLMEEIRVSKTDDRIELLGTIDELSSHIGLAKAAMRKDDKERLSLIQQELIKMMAGIAEPRNIEYKFHEEQICRIEKEIDKVENLFSRDNKFVLYGGCEISARLDIARAVARRVERRFRKVNMNYVCDMQAMKYVNRLSDYLYILARYEDYKTEQNSKNDEFDEIVERVLKNIEIK